MYLLGVLLALVAAAFGFVSGVIGLLNLPHADGLVLVAFSAGCWWLAKRFFRSGSAYAKPQKRRTNGPCECGGPGPRKDWRQGFGTYTVPCPQCGTY